MSLPRASEGRDARAYSKKFLRLLMDDFKLDQHSPHGAAHWMRVMRNGLDIARHVDDVDTKVLRLFAILHDSQRVGEFRDIDHGFRGAMAALTMEGQPDTFTLDEDQMNLLVEALTFHSDGFISDNPTVAACWDADRLDLLRVGISPDPEYLCLDYSKRFETIYAANKRAMYWRNHYQR